MCTRQDARIDADLANRRRITAIDTLLAAQHTIADQPALKLAERAADFVSRKLCIIAACQRLDNGC